MTDTTREQCPYFEDDEEDEGRWHCQRFAGHDGDHLIPRPLRDEARHEYDPELDEPLVVTSESPLQVAPADSDAGREALREAAAEQAHVFGFDDIEIGDLLNVTRGDVVIQGQANHKVDFGWATLGGFLLAVREDQIVLAQRPVPVPDWTVMIADRGRPTELVLVKWPDETTRDIRGEVVVEAGATRNWATLEYVSVPGQQQSTPEQQ